MDSYRINNMSRLNTHRNSQNLKRDFGIINSTKLYKCLQTLKVSKQKKRINMIILPWLTENIEKVHSVIK